MCPEPKCGKVSITFDPFMYISLPMPPESDRLIDIILIPNEPHRVPRLFL
jgi:ubiquitin carboxyl-terminal hydrolase 4/11/15